VTAPARERRGLDSRTYAWEADHGRYRDLTTGALVPSEEVQRVLQRALQADTARARDLADDYRMGRIDRTEWEYGMRAIIKDTNLYAAALARGGWSQMTASALGQVGAVVRQQYRYLDGFVRDLRTGKQPRDGGFTRRALLYVQAARGTYYRAERSVQRSLGATEERNVLAAEDTRTCNPNDPKSCTAQTARGWVPVGELIPIGQRLCLINCRCRLEYRGDFEPGEEAQAEKIDYSSWTDEQIVEWAKARINYWPARAYQIEKQGHPGFQQRVRAALAAAGVVTPKKVKKPKPPPPPVPPPPAPGAPPPLAPPVPAPVAPKKARPKKAGKVSSTLLADTEARMGRLSSLNTGNMTEEEFVRAVMKLVPGNEEPTGGVFMFSPKVKGDTIAFAYPNLRQLHFGDDISRRIHNYLRGDRSMAEWSAIRTVIHEQLHLMSLKNDGEYSKKWGKQAEEGIVESEARRLADLAWWGKGGSPDLAEMPDHHRIYGTYTRWVNPLLEVDKVVPGTREEVWASRTARERSQILADATQTWLKKTVVDPMVARGLDQQRADDLLARLSNKNTAMKFWEQWLMRVQNDVENSRTLSPGDRNADNAYYALNRILDRL
jgi:hypothetical protein